MEMGKIQHKFKKIITNLGRDGGGADDKQA